MSKAVNKPDRNCTSKECPLFKACINANSGEGTAKEYYDPESETMCNHNFCIFYNDNDIPRYLCYFCKDKEEQEKLCTEGFTEKKIISVYEKDFHKLYRTSEDQFMVKIDTKKFIRFWYGDHIASICGPVDPIYISPFEDREIRKRRKKHADSTTDNQAESDKNH